MDLNRRSFERGSTWQSIRGAGQLDLLQAGVTDMPGLKRASSSESPRLALKGSFKGDIGMYIYIYVYMYLDMDIDSDVAVSLNLKILQKGVWGSF